VGQPLDALVMDAQAPLVACSTLKNLCNTLVYASDASNTLGTIVNGHWVVQHNQHQNGERISQGFVKALKELGVR